MSTNKLLVKVQAWGIVMGSMPIDCGVSALLFVAGLASPLF
jgi:hypothetical protein